MRRDEETVNDKIPTGQVELSAEQMTVLSRADILQQHAETLARKASRLRQRQPIVAVSGTTPVRGATNHLRVKRVGED